MLIKNAKIYGGKPQDIRVRDGLIAEIGESLKAESVNLNSTSANLGIESTNLAKNSRPNSKNSRSGDLKSKNSHQNNEISRSKGENLKAGRENADTAQSTAPQSQTAQEQVLDAAGLTLLPAFIDLNVTLKNEHFSIENLRALEAECLKSGVCAVVLKDTMDFDEEGLALFLEHLKSLKVKVFAAVRVLDGFGKLKNLSTLVNKGALALQCESGVRAGVLRQCMQYAQMKDRAVFVHCYDGGYDDNGVMNDSQTSFELGLVGISAVSEFSEVAKIKQVAQFYGARVLYECLSLGRSLDLLDGGDLIQTSIHHLLKTDEECGEFNTFAKLMPPLRSKKDTLALRKALKARKIKFLSSLHSPKSITHKDVAFDEAGFGVDALGDYLSLCYSFLVRGGGFSWQEVCEFTSFNQAEFLGLNAGKIELGREANFVLFDESAVRDKVLLRGDLSSENATRGALSDEKTARKNESLYAKDELFGEVRTHFIKGKRVF